MTSITSLFLHTAGAWIGHRLGGRGRARRSLQADGIGFEDTVPMEVPSDFATLMPQALDGDGEPPMLEADAAPQASSRAVGQGDRHAALPPPSESLAHWCIDYDSCEGGPQPHRVHLLRVHTRLMCLMCYCEDGGTLRTFSWSGIQAVRDAQTGQAIDFEAWIAAYMAHQFDAEPRPVRSPGAVTH